MIAGARYFILMLLLTQCGCARMIGAVFPHPQYAGRAGKVNITIRVESGTGQPVSQALVGLVESVGAFPLLTEERMTGSGGELTIRGEYCLPMIVVAGNAKATIMAKADTMQTIAVREDAEASIISKGEITEITLAPNPTSSLGTHALQQFSRYRGANDIDRTKHPDCGSD